MPRRMKGNAGGIVFHVLNRGVRKATLFRQTSDFEAFFRVLREAAKREPMRVLALSVMPNHWHLVLWPERPGDLTRYVGWASLTHACRWQRAQNTRGTGPVYQGRFKAHPVENGRYLLALIRYVERNAVRAGLVARAEDWPWCSASQMLGTDMPPLHPWPVPKPENWLDFVNRPESGRALRSMRDAVALNAPFGSPSWRARTIERLGWRQGIRPPGHPFLDPDVCPEAPEGAGAEDENPDPASEC